MNKIVGIVGQAGSGKDAAADYLVKEYNFQKVALADPIKRYGMRVFRFSEEQLWGASEHRNEIDPRFETYENGTWESSDAWLAALWRAELYNNLYVEDLFPGNSELQEKAQKSLLKWLKALGEEHGTQLSPRIMLQSLGTEWGRSVREDMWLNYTVQTSLKLLQGGYVYDKTFGLVESAASEAPAGVVISDVRFRNELEYINLNNGFSVRIHRPSTDTAARVTGIENHASESEQKEFEDNQFNFVIVNNGTIEDLYEKLDVVGMVLTGGDS